MSRVLIVDDDVSFGRFLLDVISDRGYECVLVDTLAKMREVLPSFLPNVVLLDVMLPDGNGLDAVGEIARPVDSPELVVITGVPDGRGARMALAHGAWDYICKTDPKERIFLAVERAVRFNQEKRSARSVSSFSTRSIIARAPRMLACLKEAAKASQSDAPALILGETGSGKEVVARSIHENSRRSKGNFVAVDCAAMPAHLVESTLFGHRKGAFTGAESDRQGLVKLADGGTLFLDEVGEMPEEVQRRFLRFLQEKTFRPVGAQREESSDFRLLAATNRELPEMLSEGAFRSDLFHRLRGIEIAIPPLRQRKEDIGPLAEHFIAGICERLPRQMPSLGQDFLESLLQYPWPGNVRELIQVLESALANASGFETLFSMHLPVYVRLSPQQPARREKQPGFGGLVDPENLTTLSDVKEALGNMVEEEYLKALVKASAGSIDRAIAISGLGRARLYQLLKKHSLVLSASKV